MEFGKSCWYTYDEGCSREWLLTNGMGGYASGTLIGSNSRRYHGLLVAALSPPTDRHLLLSNLLEDICPEGEAPVALSSFKTLDGYVNKGYCHLQRAEVHYLPEFIYSCGDIFISKKIAMKQGENTTVIRYEIRNGARASVFKLSPLVNFRDHHHKSESRSLIFDVKNKGNWVSLCPKGADIELKLSVSGGIFHPYDSTYFYQMFYTVERERGLDDFEDHFMPGRFEISLKPWEIKTITFAATIEQYGLSEIDAQEVIQAEETRIKGLLNRKDYQNTLCRRLVADADHFIVYRKSTGSKTIIAGYPWFTDWGRDTMIAFTGLTLVTGRYEDAKDILYTFSKYIAYGLIPNMFPDDGQKPLYNSVDAALWYFEAVDSYLRYTGDYSFVQHALYEGMKQICQAFIEGTVYDIKMTEDGLVTAGNKHTQLTWMDAKVGDWVVTPRHGKAVEINALWYNALVVMSELSKRFDDDDIFDVIAAKAKKAFVSVFWNSVKNCLFDVVNEYGADESVRPNQILAVGLSHAVIEGEKAKGVVNRVWKELYTSYGLRTLSKDSHAYSGLCVGDSCRRDGAYHQGTVWPWLLGRFIKAYVRVNGKDGTAARNFINPFADHLRDAGVGSISEIFDGDNPHYPRGCFAQAWSVAEILRAAVEDVGLN